MSITCPCRFTIVSWVGTRLKWLVAFWLLSEAVALLKDAFAMPTAARIPMPIMSSRITRYSKKAKYVILVVWEAKFDVSGFYVLRPEVTCENLWFYLWSNLWNYRFHHPTFLASCSTTGCHFQLFLFRPLSVLASGKSGTPRLWGHHFSNYLPSLQFVRQSAWKQKTNNCFEIPFY